MNPNPAAPFFSVRPAGQASNPNPSPSPALPTPSPAVSAVVALVDVASIAACAYHGYKRNNSIGWGFVWGLSGGLFPIITPAIAVAQGFGERAKKK